MPASIKHLTDRRVIYNSLLARWKDGLYYTAVLTKCDRANKKCRVCFEDGSEIWVSNRDLHIQLTSEDEDIVCCICDDGKSEPPNEIIICDVCQQGYHQNCHLPPVDSSKLDDSESQDHKDWFCATCSFILNQTNRAKLSATVAAAQQQQQQHQERTTRASSNSTPSSSSKPKQEARQASASHPASRAVQTTNTGPVISQQTVIAAPSKTAVPEMVSPAIIRSQAPVVKNPPKVKQTPTIQQQANQKMAAAMATAATPSATVGPIKAGANQHQRSAPYYPLSSQVRAMASSSTAALASMTASSALVVGSSAGRTKSDLVKQSNRSTQRQISIDQSDTGVIVPKHAVRKSSINFSTTPIKQSALPTATRSSPSSVATITMAKNLPTQQPVSSASMTVLAPKPTVTLTPVTTVTPQAPNSSYTIVALTDQTGGQEVAKVKEADDQEVGKQTKDQATISLNPMGSPKLDSLPKSSMDLSELHSDASSDLSASSGLTIDKSESIQDELNISNISNNSPPERDESQPPSVSDQQQQQTQQSQQQQQTADSTRSSIDSGNDTISSSSNNKPTTVIVAAKHD